MIYNNIETLIKSNFLNKWEEEINKILSKGVIWIDKKLIWEIFRNQYDLEIPESKGMDLAKSKKLNDITDEKLYQMIINTLGNLVNEMY